MAAGWDFPRATVVGVHDGDTVTMDVDLGFGISRRGLPFRLLGLNARELRDPGGSEARANLLTLIPIGTMLRLTSVKDDKYARYLAVLWLGDTDICQRLIDTDWAAAWNGKGAKPLPPWPRT
jgi:endonuclease YncB( thermonuclease family)